MKNYLEVEHYYVDEEGDENWDVYHAVRPTPSSYQFKGRERETAYGGSWVVEPGGTLHVGTVHEIAAMRKLLDAIEEEIKAEH